MTTTQEKQEQEQRFCPVCTNTSAFPAEMPDCGCVQRAKNYTEWERRYREARIRHEERKKRLKQV